MSGADERWRAVDDFITGMLVGPDPALDAALAAEPRLSATELQTVGSKGYDGFALALVLP